MEETIFCYLFCFWEPPGHVTCSYCEYCLKKSWLTTLRLKSSFHIWGFLYSISPTWIRGLQVVAENVWHLCSLKGSSTDNVLEESSAVTSQICSPEHRKRHCFVLSVCRVHLLSTCSTSVHFLLVYVSCSASTGTRWRMVLPTSPCFPF